MRAFIERCINQLWYERRHSWLAWLLWPLAHVYRFLFKRLWAAKAAARATKLPAPIVVVGNIVAGGSGKTPVVASLCIELQALGYKVGIISRGYGGKQIAPAIIDSADVAQFGDEACMLAAQTGAPVAVGQARLDVAQMLCRQFVLDVILSDDGLQHASLPRQMEICVIGARGLGNGFGLPAGPLREPVQRLHSVDAILSWTQQAIGLSKVNRPSHIVHGHNASLRHLNGKRCFWKTLNELGAAQVAGQFPVYALAAVAQPARFYGQLSMAGVRFTPLSVADHGVLSLEKWRTLAPKSYVLMTEKDAIKYQSILPDYWQERCIVVPWRVRLPQALVQQVVQLIRQFTAAKT